MPGAVSWQAPPNATFFSRGQEATRSTSEPSSGTHVSYAHGPFRSPRSLEEHSRHLLLHFDANTVEDVDRHPVARVPFAIATAIGPHEAGARLIIRLEGSAVEQRAPGLIAEAHALPMSSGRAGDAETFLRRKVPTVRCPTAPDWKAHSAAIRVGLADVPRAGARVGSRERVQHDLTRGVSGTASSPAEWRRC